VYDAFGDYRYAFFTTGALALIALGALTLAKAPTRQSATV
jgi:hypothetical protein